MTTKSSSTVTERFSDTSVVIAKRSDMPVEDISDHADDNIFYDALMLK